MSQTTQTALRHYESVFLSDIHLGHKACRADLLQDFLDGLECRNLYLLGDIIDCQALARSDYWPPSHQQILDTLFARARKGTRVIYVPGNHDEDYRALCGTRIGAIEIHRQYHHRLRNGESLLLIHGDCLDEDIPTSALLRWVGHHGSEWLVHLNRWVNGISRVTGGPYRQASNRIKARIRRIAQHIETFSEHARAAARDSGCVGVVAGHIHYPALASRDNQLYANCGDWVESCTALVETLDGRLELLHHGHQPRSLAIWESPVRRPRRLAA